MSYALDALMLIQLDAHKGEWVDTKTLAAHYSLLEHVVEEALDSLAKRGLIRAYRDTSTGPVVRAVAFAKDKEPA